MDSNQTSSQKKEQFECKAFFLAIQELSNESQITKTQKIFLKTSLINQQENLMQVLQKYTKDADRYDDIYMLSNLKDQLCIFLKDYSVNIRDSISNKIMPSDLIQQQQNEQNQQQLQAQSCNTSLLVSHMKSNNNNSMNFQQHQDQQQQQLQQQLYQKSQFQQPQQQQQQQQVQNSIYQPQDSNSLIRLVNEELQKQQVQLIKQSQYQNNSISNIQSNTFIDNNNNPQSGSLMNPIQFNSRQRFAESDLFDFSGRFEKYLIEQVTEKGVNFSIFEKKKLQKLRKFIGEVLDQQGMNSPLNKKGGLHSPQQLSPSDQNMESDFQKSIKDIKSYYQIFKFFLSQILNNIVIIMEENISYVTLLKVMKDLENSMFGYDNFSFIVEEQGLTLLYQSKNDEYSILEESGMINHIHQEIMLIQRNYFLDSSQIPEQSNLGKIISMDEFEKTTLFRFSQQPGSNVLFFFHQSPENIEQTTNQLFFELDNIPQIQEIVIDFSSLAIDSIRQGKTNFFNPTISGSIIIDISSRILNRLDYLMREEIRIQLQKNLHCNVVMELDKETAVKEEGKLLFSLKDNTRKQEYFYAITEPIFLPKNLNSLTNKILQIYEKLTKVFAIQDQKLILYKYLFKNNNKVFLEYNKTGELIFMNQPISQYQKNKYNIQLNVKMIEEYNMVFEQMFKGNKKIQDEIRDFKNNPVKQNNFINSNAYPEIEFYIRNVQGKNDGFIIVLSDPDFSHNHSERISVSAKSSSSHKEHGDSSQNAINTLNSIDEGCELNIESKRKLESQMKRIVSFQETIHYINDLKNQQPEVNDSQLQLFFPSDIKNEGQKFLKENSLIMGRFKVNKKQRQKRKYSGEQQQSGISPGKKAIQVNIKYSTDIFTSDEKDDEVETLDWNALNIQTTKEMHRTVWNIFNRGGWIVKYKIPHETLIEFLMELERKYNKRKNPFHNYLHGIAVMQASYRLAKCKKALKYLSDFQVFILTFSGLCHDVSHPGRTNVFMVNSMDKLAIRYHDDSVLERHHLAQTFHLLQEDKFNIFKNMTHEEFKQLRKEAISNILYTDISKHFPLMKDFSKTFKLPEEKPNDSARLSVDQPPEIQEPIFGSGSDDITYLCGAILHTADFSGGAKPFEISRIWSERVNKEFSAQYEEEGQKGITQTPFFKDLDKKHIAAKGEIGFFKFIVQPLWNLLNEFLEGELDQNCEYLNQVVEKWQQIQEEFTPKEQEQENSNNSDKK